LPPAASHSARVLCAPAVEHAAAKRKRMKPDIAERMKRDRQMVDAPPGVAGAWADRAGYLPVIPWWLSDMVDFLRSDRSAGMRAAHLFR